MSENEINKYLNASKLCLEFLDRDDIYTGSSFLKDKDGDGFDTDVGYLYEGLEQMIKYFERKL